MTDEVSSEIFDATHYDIDHASKPADNVRQSSLRKFNDVRRRLQQRTSARFEAEILTVFARNEVKASLYTPLFAIVIAVCLINWINPAIVGLWLAVTFFIRFGVVMLARAYLGLKESQRNTKKWQERFIIIQLMDGIVWAISIYLCLLPSAELPHIFIFCLAIASISIRMNFTTATVPMALASTLPISLTAIIALLSLQQQVFSLLAIFAMGIHIYFLLVMRSVSESVNAMLEYRYEKDALVSELEQAKLNSDEARIRAEEANSAKSRFLATMSHELRTPLNAIIGFSEIMTEESFGPHATKQYKEYSADILASGQHLLKLINEILDLSRIEAERYELSESAIKLTDISDDCMRLLSIRAKQKNLRIDVSANDKLSYLWADERAIRQICLNILSNAIKFSPQGSRVTITVDKNEAGEQYIQFEDNGPGIPEAEISKVLSPFGQGALAHESNETGSGLGLPIVQKLVQLHGGHLKLTSELRKGTIVRASFPKERVIHALPAIIETDDNGVYKYTISELDKRTEEFSRITEQIRKIMDHRISLRTPDDQSEQIPLKNGA